MKKQLFVIVACLSLAAAWAANGPKLPSLLDGQSLVVALR